MNRFQLKKLREILGFPQWKMAEVIFMERRAIIYMEKGQRSITKKTDKLLKLLFPVEYKQVMEVKK